MKNTIYAVTLSLAVVLAGCGEFTDVKPKGRNILDRVDHLDMLLNYDFSQTPMEMMYLVNDFLPQLENIPNLIANHTAPTPVKTVNSILATWDETGDRASLTVSDGIYEGIYKVIGTVANPVLNYADKASGDRAKADRLKAEAYVLRAYFHYLAVNTYAKAYNPATAATDPGVPYLFYEADVLNHTLRKSTVQQVYDYILDDLKAALDLNSLPDIPATMRVGKAFAYAVQAKALMSTRDYTGAYAAAEKSLAINNTVHDHRPDAAAGLFNRPEFASSEDLFNSWSQLLPNAFTSEMATGFEPGSILINYYPSDRRLIGMQLFAMYYYGVPVDVWYGQNVAYSSLGLTTVDMYLTKAECRIREGKLSDAMDLINHIRERRTIPAQYVPKTAATAAEAMTILKQVSRCENFFTTKNFINIKRWNTEDAYKETLTKALLGKTYTLKPDSPLWIFPFPQSATSFNPELTQNY